MWWLWFGGFVSLRGFVCLLGKIFYICTWPRLASDSSSFCLWSPELWFTGVYLWARLYLGFWKLLKDGKPRRRRQRYKNQRLAWSIQQIPSQLEASLVYTANSQPTGTLVTHSSAAAHRQVNTSFAGDQRHPSPPPPLGSTLLSGECRSEEMYKGFSEVCRSERHLGWWMLHLVNECFIKGHTSSYLTAG
jgi:hypothetical protein